MNSLRRISTVLFAVCALAAFATVTRAADPGLTYPPTSELSDQKAGSLLIYTYYTSATAAPHLQNTRISLTNTSTTSAMFVHLFFVDGATCSISDRFVCLTTSQTLSFLTSEQDPGTTGYLVAITVDGVFGCPVAQNWLIGDASIKTETGHLANLGAEAFAALYNGVLPGCDGNSTTAVVNFNGVVGAGYNGVARVLAVSSITSQADGNDQRLIMIRVAGNLAIGAATLASIFGLLYNDQEESFSWTVVGGCQLVRRLDNLFPRTTPRFDVVIPAGQTGWMKFFSQSDIGILGSVINHNPNAATAAGAFRSGRNLHKLTLSFSAVYTIPVFPPSC